MAVTEVSRVTMVAAGRGGGPWPSGPTALAAQGIVKSFGGQRVLAGVDLMARAGEVVGLVGENGAGKSTLLRICAGLLEPDQGTIEVSGRVGFCPQDPGLLDLLTADEHLVYFGAARGLSRSTSVAVGRRILNEFGFPTSGDRMTKQLSGGTRQKLNLALALLGDPAVLLLDEPYQGFDRGVYVNFWDHVDRWAASGKAVVIVTHMLAELNRVDRVVELAAERPLAVEAGAR
jgi:ABC-type multidrug transport system ATPase subunit